MAAEGCVRRFTVSRRHIKTPAKVSLQGLQVRACIVENGRTNRYTANAELSFPPFSGTVVTCLPLFFFFVLLTYRTTTHYRSG